MSQLPISLSSDLTQLKEDGYELEIQHKHLLVRSIPYVNSKKEIRLGTLVSELNLAGDVTTIPGTHVAKFIGEHPCNKDGSEIAKIKHGSVRETLGVGLTVDHSFSARPKDHSGEAYPNYYEKIIRYVAIISGPAESIDPSVTARTHRVVESTDPESIFNYMDTASSRAGINLVTDKLEIAKVAIVGLGGTGSYILDFISKTPIKSIHLFDGDRFLQHNAFRSPGAPSIEQLRELPYKVDYFKNQYSKMRQNIVAHNYYIDDANFAELQEMNFVFLCLDKGEPKKLIMEKLEEYGTSFIDTGMGLYLTDDSLAGTLRTTTSTPGKRDHFRTKARIAASPNDGNQIYTHNIQITDLNALNAALAVIKWKKIVGFYHDLEKEHHSFYDVDGNSLINEDQV